MPDCYFAIGTTLANMVNLETIVGEGEAPHVLDDAWIPYMAAEKERALDNATIRDGAITQTWRWNSLLLTALNAFIYDQFGDFTTPSVERYISSIDETGHYSPFLVTLDKPHVGENYRIAPGGVYVVELEIPLVDCELQSVEVSADGTVTTSQRLTYVDTSSADVTRTLFDVATATLNTVYSFVKVASANTLILDGGAALIDGASTKSVTALNGRVDLVTRDNLSWVSVSAR